MACDWPEDFFDERIIDFRQPLPEPAQLERAAQLIKAAKRPLIVCGGGVLYSQGGSEALRRFAQTHGIPVGESQAGKGALPWDMPLLSGSIGVTGSPAANELVAHAPPQRPPATTSPSPRARTPRA